ncbi:MAG: hypothetical protein F6K19_18665 [Cyanothece sp. SIO1E1]|nr:hypothetical protein [Cyanothece sp. SIO1E1]
MPQPDNQAQQGIGRNPGQAFGQLSGGQAINISGGHVSFVDGQGNSLPQETLNRKREIPSLLPYLPNRTEQEFELRQAIQKLMSQSTMRQPLICLVHGDEWQSHDKFLERLRKVSLPRLLRLDLKQSAIKEYHLQWPDNLKKLDQLSARLAKNLADTVENDSFATVEQINQTFRKYPGPVLVHLHLLTDDWQRLGPGLLPKVLEFWQIWPELGADQTLVICIFIKYQFKRSTKKRQRWWLLNPFAWLKRFLKCRHCQKLNRAIAEQLASLAGSDFRDFNRLTGIVLPKLDNINRGHVEDWVRCKETKIFAGEAVLEKLIGAVGKMFEHDETMPMDTVATRLTTLLQETVTSGRNLR